MVGIFLCKKTDENKVLNVFMNENDAKNYLEKYKQNQARRNLLITNGGDAKELDKVDTQIQKFFPKLNQLYPTLSINGRTYKRFLRNYPNITDAVINTEADTLTQFVVTSVNVE